MSFATTPDTLANLAHLTPRPVKAAYGDNYLNFAADDFGQWTQQFLPEVYEKEIERYGNRTVSGFLRMVGAEMPMASDQVVWQEQGRLHIAYDEIAVASASTLTFTSGHLIGAGMTLVLNNGYTTHKAYVSGVSGVTVTVELYDTSDGNLPAAWVGNDPATELSVFVYGSEYAKGSSGAGNSIGASFTTFSNKPMILRDKYSVKGSDVAQIGWVEVTSEAGTSGYLWYLKSEHESRLRFEDYLEMSMVEAEKAQSTITPATAHGTPDAKIEGSQGLFAALEERGLVFNDNNFNGSTNAFTGIDEFDLILNELDKQGAIEENMMFLDRSTSLHIDNMLARINAPHGSGASFGVFENNAEMALNLGFSGFRRGSYDFYKTDWKYLNDSVTRGGIGDIQGVIVPAGTSTVYDQMMGQNITRPFLHVRYRASEADDRRLKSWVTGSVGGNYTSDADEMNVHFLSERALCVQAANNFVLLKKTQA
jgi:hypothetical protein